MKFAGTAAWDSKSGGYELELSDGKTSVHLHDTDLINVGYNESTQRLTLVFQYDSDYATGVLRTHPILRMTFHECTVQSWEDDFTMPGVIATSGGLDMSVKALDFDGEDSLVLEAGPTTLRFQAQEVHVTAHEAHSRRAN